MSNVEALVEEAAIVVDGVSKRYPPFKGPNIFLRILAPLGGVELEGETLPDAEEEEEEEEVEEREPRNPDEWVEAVRSVALTIEPGVCLGIVGPEGSGKSVLLRLMAGQTPPSEGRVIVRGTVAPALPTMTKFVPSRVGIKKTLLALAMMTRLSRREVKRKLPEIFALAGLPAESPPGTTLTPAQKQRLLLAMMLSVEADVVLIDVPLGVPPVRFRFADRIRELCASGAAVVIAAEFEHEIADVADRFVYIDAGQIVLEDEPASTVAIFSEDGSAPEEDGEPEPREDVLPLSPDAKRYLDFVRLLIGDRAETAYRLAAAAAADGAKRIEWTAIADAARFDWVEHAGVVERLRAIHGVIGEEPIYRASARAELPLSPDALRYVEFLRVLAGKDRAEQARRNALAAAPDDAERVEWSWIARWGGFDRAEHFAVVQRLRQEHGATEEEPIFGAKDYRRPRQGGG